MSNSSNAFEILLNIFALKNLPKHDDNVMLL